MRLLVRLHCTATDLRRRQEDRGATSVEYALMLGMIAVACISSLTYFQRANSSVFNRSANAMNASNTEALGRILYTKYLLPFELAAVVLLVAMVAAIALTMRERKSSKSQIVGDQVRVMAADRLKIIKMDAVQEPATVPAAPAEAALAPTPAPTPTPAPPVPKAVS